MKPLFTVHAGEFLVACHIEQHFRNVRVWVPTKDKGIDLLVSNTGSTRTVSLQVKFSRDYSVTHMQRDPALLAELRGSGWWNLKRRQIETSQADYWVFVLVGFANRSTDFIIIEPQRLLTRLDAIHPNAGQNLHSYFCVTRALQCYERRGLNRADEQRIAEQDFRNRERNFTRYLNNWRPITRLNG